MPVASAAEGAAARARTAWPAGVINPQTGVADATQFGTWASYKDFVTGATNQNTLLEENEFAAITNDNWKTDASKLKKLNAILAPWAQSYQPEHRWWNYIATKHINWDDVKNTPATDRFIPSIGLYKYDPTHETIEKEKSGVNISTDDVTSGKYCVEAGTDCLGFAQRSASWNGNTYVWNEINAGWTDIDKSGNGVENVWDQINKSASRVYPTHQSSSSQIILHNRNANDSTEPSVSYLKTKKGKDKAELTLGEKSALLARLKLIIPGDIFEKNSDKEDKADWHNHIAIVLKTPDNPENITDVDDYMSKIIIIESEFNSILQSVLNWNTLGNYNNNTFPSSAHNGYLYPGVLIPQGMSLNSGSWAIVRLK